ncbi:MAG: hypothetical protein MJZ50_08610 [Treponema sp.]|nr:hypothetical protein [Treponema sp.]
MDKKKVISISFDAVISISFDAVIPDFTDNVIPNLFRDLFIHAHAARPFQSRLGPSRPLPSFAFTVWAKVVTLDEKGVHI